MPSLLRRLSQRSKASVDFQPSTCLNHASTSASSPLQETNDNFHNDTFSSSPSPAAHTIGRALSRLSWRGRSTGLFSPPRPNSAHCCRSELHEGNQTTKDTGDGTTYPSPPENPAAIPRSRSGTVYTDIKSRVVALAQRNSQSSPQPSSWRQVPQRRHRLSNCLLSDDSSLEADEEVRRAESTTKTPPQSSLAVGPTECDDRRKPLLRRRFSHGAPRQLQVELDPRRSIKRQVTRPHTQHDDDAHHFSLFRMASESPESEKSLYESLGGRPLRIKSDGVLRIEHGICSRDEHSERGKPLTLPKLQRSSSLSELESRVRRRERMDEIFALSVSAAASETIEGSSSRKQHYRHHCSAAEAINAAEADRPSWSTQSISCRNSGGLLPDHNPPSREPPVLLMSHIWTRERIAAQEKLTNRAHTSTAYSGLAAWRPHLHRGLTDSAVLRKRSQLRSASAETSNSLERRLFATQLDLQDRGESIPLSSEAGRSASRATRVISWSAGRPRSESPEMSYPPISGSANGCDLVTTASKADLCESYGLQHAMSARESLQLPSERLRLRHTEQRSSSATAATNQVSVTQGGELSTSASPKIPVSRLGGSSKHKRALAHLDQGDTPAADVRAHGHNSLSHVPPLLISLSQGRRSDDMKAASSKGINGRVFQMTAARSTSCPISLHSEG